MIFSFISKCSLPHYFKIIISFGIFANHTSIQSRHQLLILFSGMITCTIFPHHVSNPGCFSNSKVFYMIVCFFVSSFYLSDDRQDIYRFDVGDFYGFVILRITYRNDNCHSRYEEILQECLQSKMILSGHTLLYL